MKTWEIIFKIICAAVSMGVNLGWSCQVAAHHMVPRLQGFVCLVNGVHSGFRSHENRIECWQMVIMNVLQDDSFEPEDDFQKIYEINVCPWVSRRHWLHSSMIVVCLQCTSCKLHNTVTLSSKGGVGPNLHYCCSLLNKLSADQLQHFNWLQSPSSTAQAAVRVRHRRKSFRLCTPHCGRGEEYENDSTSALYPASQKQRLTPNQIWQCIYKKK